MPLLRILTTLVLCCAAVSTAGAAPPVDLPAPDKLVELLRTGDGPTRQKTLDALAANVSLADKYKDVLRGALKDDDAKVRQQAAMALAAFGFADKAIIDELIAGLGQTRMFGYLARPDDTYGAMQSLEKLGVKSVPALVVALKDEKFAGRGRAVMTLGAIGPPAKEALPALAEAMKNRDLSWFTNCVDAKWRIDRDADTAIEQLWPLVLDEKGKGQYAPLRVLAHMGPAAKPALPRLLKALDEYHDRNVLWAVRELAPHFKEQTMPALRKAFANPKLADDAAIALQGMGEPVEAVLPRQLERLANFKPGDGSDPVRIAYTIAIYGPDAKAYGDELATLLKKHPQPVVRRAAAWAVCRVSADPKMVKRVLEEALKDPEVVEEATRSLKVLADSLQ